LAPYLNTDTVNAFFQQFEKEVDPRIQVFLIWDQAGFHTSDKVRIPSNVTLVPLPPYSPQLNPIEKLWQYLRQHYWSNRVYDDYDHLRQAANEAWKRVCLEPKKVKSICRANYLKRAFS
jgi:transposase